MLKEWIYYIGKDKLRKYERLIKQYPFYVLAVIIMSFIMIPIFVETLLTYQQSFFVIFPYIVYVYSILKYMQNNPFVMIKMPYFQFKMFNLNQLKGYIIFKIVFPSFFVGMAFFALFQTLPMAIIISLLLNITVNYLCFIRYQVCSKRIMIFSVAFIMIGGFFAIYIQSFSIIGAMFIICMIHLFTIKKLDYSILYPYYQTMHKVGEGLLNKDFTKMFEAQQVLSGHPEQKNRQNCIRFYENNFLYFLDREWSKLFFHQKEVRNIVISMLMVNLFYSILSRPYNLAAYGILLFLITHTLTLVTKREVDLMKQSVIFPMKSTSYLKYKYFANLTITIILFLFNGWVMKDILLVSLIIVWMIPFVNLMYVYVDQKIVKYLLTLIQGVIYGLPYFSFLI